MAGALLALLIAGAGGAVAWGSNSQATSQPNGDVQVRVSVGCAGSDRDKDGDLNTCVGGDTMSRFYSVANLSDVTQTIRIDYRFDGPGADLDRASTQDVVLGPNEFVDERDTIRVQNGKTPLGEYTLTITGSGSETASTSGSVTVGTKNGG